MPETSAVPRPDLDLFDAARLQAALDSHPPVTAFKQTLRAAREEMDALFRQGCEIQSLIRGRARFIDCILQQIWQRFDWDTGSNIALLAVGGYGRGELHPGSDIDLLLLVEEDGRHQHRVAIEGFLMFLWDIGLEVGQSVRTIAECAELAETDLTIITNLMESRTLAGPEKMREAMRTATRPEAIWPSPEFFLAKHQEQLARHEKYNDTEYNLEPNVKGSPGGLRDIQTLTWIANRQFGTATLNDMCRQGFLKPGELERLEASRDFLWRVRYALHMLAGRAEDRLLFDYQRQIAELLGFETQGVKSPLECFMQKYYRVVMVVAELTDLLRQYFEEVIINPDFSAPAQPLNDHFQTRNGYLEALHDKVFEEEPHALLETFVLLAQHPELKGVRADTIRLLRDQRHLIDDDFRADPRNTRLFMELLRCKEGIHRNLRRMHRYAILARYLPEFGHIVGQMQHDLYHIYTVDAHTLNVLKHLRKLKRAEMTDRFALASKLMDKLPQPELIYVAGLYHDIAKGRGGDHSELGAVDAEAFCSRHGLPEADTALVVWLVRSHLMMSAVAQRKDLSDPQVINDFAQQVGNEDYLNYLYIFTVCDINATNPSLWNSWRASLLRQLYTETKHALKRGLDNPLIREEQILQTRSMTLDQLVRNGTDPDDAEALWAQLGEDYFLRHTAADVAWHTEAIIDHPADAGPLILIRETTQRDFEGGTQIFIYAPDQHDFFAATVAEMDQLNLSIHDARILTSTSQFTLDTYIVLEADGSSIGHDPERIEEIRQGLISALHNPDGYQAIIQRRVPRQLKHFAFPPQILIHNDTQRAQTVLEVIAPDRPGLLARIGRLFRDFDISVQNAKIATLAERVEDVFYVTDAHNRPLSDFRFCSRLQLALMKELSEET